MTPTNRTSNPCRALQAFLMLSYAYYIRHTSLIPDTEFDKITRYLLEHIDDPNFKHQHKHLVTKDMLKAGTAFNLREQDYPSIVKGAAELWIRGNHLEQIDFLEIKGGKE